MLNNKRAQDVGLSCIFMLIIMAAIAIAPFVIAIFVIVWIIKSFNIKSEQKEELKKKEKYHQDIAEASEKIQPSEGKK